MSTLNKHEEGDKPTKVVRDEAYMPLGCHGNGMPLEAHAAACPIRINHGEPIWIAHWRSSPHHTIHCRACRDQYFERQGKLL